jgi:lipid A oxidase
MAGRLLAAVTLASLCAAGPARADWMAAAYLGGATTQSNTLTLQQPALGTRAVLTNVEYASRSFESPLYYGVRLTRYFGRLGIEGELVHLKAYARPDRPVGVSGTLDGAQINATVPFGSAVERFSASHGLNYVLVNAVLRHRTGTGASPRAWVEARAGGGIAIPHGESRIAEVDQEQYEFGGAAFDVAAGAQIRIARQLYATADYKLTTSAPSISVASGTISGRFTSHHLTAGLAAHF